MSAPHEPIRIMNRITGEEETEIVMGDGFLRFAYETAAGRSLWGLLFNHAAMSRWLGRYFDSRFSKRQIKAMVRDLHIDTTEIELPVRGYKTFNQFFTRKLKAGERPFEPREDSLASPADGRLFAYTGCSADAAIPVKGAQRTLRDLCGGELPEGEYAVIVVRLCPADYHRFHFPCSCEQIGETLKIAGKYHSVNPVALALRPDLFVENARQVTCLTSEAFGAFRYIEVGAFGVASIVQTAGEGPYRKMQEKGYFQYGASTVILVLDDKRVKIDDDLLENTAAGIETKVRVGNEIGSAV